MSTRFTTRLMSFGLAALVTLAMLGGVDTLATSERAPAMLAHAAATAGT